MHIPSPDDLPVNFNRLTRMRFRIFPTSEDTGKRDRLAELEEQAPLPLTYCNLELHQGGSHSQVLVCFDISAYPEA